MDAVEQQSRLVGMKDISETALKIHKQRSAIDQKLWIKRYIYIYI
jgi:hypothetical protein